MLCDTHNFSDLNKIPIKSQFLKHNFGNYFSFFFQVAATSLESSLIKYSAKEYFFRASLCHLCVDAVNAQHAIQRYEEQFPAFGDSRECKLVKVGRSVSQFDNKISTY